MSACSAIPATRVVCQAIAARLSEETTVSGQKQSSWIRQQREMSRKLKAAEKRAKRQSRITEKPKGGTEEPKSAAAGADDRYEWR
jgi:hypothetical protein